MNSSFEMQRLSSFPSGRGPAVASHEADAETPEFGCRPKARSSLGNLAVLLASCQVHNTAGSGSPYSGDMNSTNTPLKVILKGRAWQCATRMRPKKRMSLYESQYRTIVEQPIQQPLGDTPERGQLHRYAQPRSDVLRYPPPKDDVHRNRSVSIRNSDCLVN